jgi:serine/threonine protein kinase
MLLEPPSPPGHERCPNCGAPLSEQAPQGLCPKCLFARLAVATEDGAGAAAQAPSQTPEELSPHFPQLEILECLGRGGMGVVYKARQKSLNRFVALKLLAPERVADAKFAHRFTHEAQALAALNHPNIVTIYDFGQAGGFYFLLMEFVDGVNLRQAIRAGRFKPEQALAIVPRVCEALQYAHEHGIVHRDIKPENLLLDKEGRVKIADFGIAKMLGSDADPAVRDEGPQAGTLASAAGTPQYMAPEQKEHRVTDHRADIYSLGVVLYEMLTGELPADNLQPPSSRIRGMQIDVRLDEIVLRALEKTPELRYQTAVEFRTQLENLTGGPSEIHGTASGGIFRPSRFSRPAIIAACWITLSVFVLPPFFWHELKTHEFENSGPFSNFLGVVVAFLFLLPAVTAPMGATILGWIAVTQIRRSAGKLYGIWLAVFDGLFFPLLALDAVTVVATRVVMSPGGLPAVGPAVTAIVVIVMIVIVIVVDFLIIRRVWRAVNQPPNGALPADQPKPKRLKTKLWLVLISVLGVGLIGVSLNLYLSPSRRSDRPWAQIHTRIFEADAKLVDELVPGPTRKPGQMQDSEEAIRIAPIRAGQPSRAPQTAEISADVFARLLADGANPPGLLDEQIREGTWWPKVATNSHYMRHGNPAGGGNLDGFLGIWKRKGVLQLHVEYNGIHGMNSAYQVVRIGWEGGAPPPKAARAFFIPVSRMDGTARYLVMAFEVGNGTENGEPNLSFGPVIERVVPEAIDFDSGKLASLPESVTTKDNIAEAVLSAVGWMEREGMDAFADTRTHFFGVGMRAIAQDKSQWEKLTATQIVALLDASVTQPSAYVPLEPLDGSATYAIQTREGGKGILQILGSTDDGVRLRYKLVQHDAAQTAAVVKSAAAAVTPTFGPVMERVLPSGVPCREQYFQFRSGAVFVVGNGPGTSKEEAAYDEQKIDDAGGVDMSAGSGETGISIAGRGCFFTQDVEGLKWESITAEQVMERLKYVSFVNGVVEPRTKDFPITYLFKTARGEVGIMEVKGVVDDQRDGWIEKGMKFRYKLVQGTGTTTPAATTKSSLVFGPETRGLQAAIEVTPGEPFKLRIHVRNASDRGISIGGARYRQDDECLLTDAQGQPVPVTKVTHDIKIGMKGGYFSAGQVAVFESAGLSFQDIDKAPASAGYIAKSGPGRYTLRFHLRLPGDDALFVVGERDWKGELETGPVTIEVKEPVAPIADSPSSAILGPVVERTVNDLQTSRESCALSFDSGKLLPVPANITLDTLTNPSAQPVAVAWARDNRVDAVAFITIDAGKIVKCGLLCPGLLVLRANNPEWVWDSPTPRELKEEFDKAMHEWKEFPHIAEVTSDGHFPANYMILDTRTRRRGVLQIMGVADQPRSVKIRYRLVEGAPVKKTSQSKQPADPQPTNP